MQPWVPIVIPIDNRHPAVEACWIIGSSHFAGTQWRQLENLENLNLEDAGQWPSSIVTLRIRFADDCGAIRL